MAALVTRKSTSLGCSSLGSGFLVALTRDGPRYVIASIGTSLRLLTKLSTRPTQASGAVARRSLRLSPTRSVVTLKTRRDRAMANTTRDQETIRKGAERAGGERGPDAVDLLTSQHRMVEEMFKKLEAEKPGSTEYRRLFADLADALAVHATIEEK